MKLLIVDHLGIFTRVSHSLLIRPVFAYPSDIKSHGDGSDYAPEEREQQTDHRAVIVHLPYSFDALLIPWVVVGSPVRGYGF